MGTWAVGTVWFVDCEDWDDDGDMALLVRREEVRDAQADDVPFMDGLGHSPVVPHPRQLRPPPSYRLVSAKPPEPSAARP